MGEKKEIVNGDSGRNTPRSRGGSAENRNNGSFVWWVFIGDPISGDKRKKRTLWVHRGGGKAIKKALIALVRVEGQGKNMRQRRNSTG